jgi:septum formation protein
MSRYVYLASQSPRRLELLRQIGLSPVVLTLRHTGARADVDETPLPDEKAVDYVLRLAEAKARAGLMAMAGRRLMNLPIVAADTTVTIDGAILGKPANPAEAADMLRRYSGRTHTVLTAVSVAYLDQVKLALSESTVRFRVLEEREITMYVDSAESFDKAGGYGIQGRAATFIEHIAGSYSGVMGLPLFETSELLKSVGYAVL